MRFIEVYKNIFELVFSILEGGGTFVLRVVDDFWTFLWLMAGVIVVIVLIIFAMLFFAIDCFFIILSGLWQNLISIPAKLERFRKKFGEVNSFPTEMGKINDSGEFIEIER